MMLSEEAKAALRETLTVTIMIAGLARCQRIGPAKFLDGIENGRSKEHPTTLEITANRKEAEQYLAGLLGLS